MAALAAALTSAGTALAVAPAAPRAVRVVLYPIQLKGERVPARAQLEAPLRRLSQFMERVTYGRIRVSGEVAPPFEGCDAGDRRQHHPAGDAGRRGVAGDGRRGLVDGAIPMFVAPSRVDKQSFSNGDYAVIQGHGLQRSGATVAHEFGHMLGLDHARAPRACPRPFRPGDVCRTAARRRSLRGHVRRDGLRPGSLRRLPARRARRGAGPRRAAGQRDG